MKQKSLSHRSYSSQGSLLLNLALVLTVVGLIAIIALQVLDLRKYVGH